MSTSNNYQAAAIATFSTMLERATSYRNGEELTVSQFDATSGICGNVEKCVPNEYRRLGDTMLLVKDNVIRRLPSYSGNYHYPVPHPCPAKGTDPEVEAEECFDNSSDKWSDDYGLERWKQLAELVDYVKNKWSDELAQTISPAKRVGLIKGITIVQRIECGTLWVLDYDDGSTDPYFIPLDDANADRVSIDLHYLRVLKNEAVGKKTVKGFISAIEKAVAKRTMLEAQVESMRKQIGELKRLEGVLDYNLGEQHGVKRL